MNKKGYLLIDSLIVVFITSILCFMCYQIYLSISNYETGYQEYQKNSNDYYRELYNNLSNCEACIIDEFD